jgi:uncharacterized membrane protein YqiK
MSGAVLVIVILVVLAIVVLAVVAFLRKRRAGHVLIAQSSKAGSVSGKRGRR